MVRPMNMPMKQAPRGGGNLGTSDGGKPEKKALPMKQPVGPKRSGAVSCRSPSGTQGKH